MQSFTRFYTDALVVENTDAKTYSRVCHDVGLTHTSLRWCVIAIFVSFRPVLKEANLLFIFGFSFGFSFDFGFGFSLGF